MLIIDMIRSLYALFVRICGHLAFLPALAARLAMGATFAIAGWGKLHNLDHVKEYFKSIGIPESQAPFAAYNEFICGSLLIVGLFSRFAAIPLIIVMCVAMTFDPDLHKKITDVTGAASMSDRVDAFSTFAQVAEFLNIILLGYIVIHGPGMVSLDAVLQRLFGKPKPAAAGDGDKKKD